MKAQQLKQIIIRNLRKKTIPHGGVIDATTIMLQAVTHDEVFYLQHHVVTRNLVEYSLRNLDMRSLVLHNHPSTQILVVEHRIASLAGAVKVELYLVGQQARGVALHIRQVVHKMLPHPLFGG